MGKSHTFIRAVIGCLLLIATQSIAAPFLPLPFEIKQADGTPLTIRQYGDEHFNYTTTLDNKLLVYSSGTYYYANTNGQNSGIAAKNKENRNTSELQFLSTTDQVQALTHYRQLVGRKYDLTIDNNRLKSSSNIDFPAIKKIANGKKKIVVVMVESPQKSICTKASDWDLQLNQPGYNKNNHHGSVRDYFLTQSRGKLDLTFDIHGPVHLSRRIENLSESDILQEAVNGVDFNPYDYDDDNDGYIDCVVIITAGRNIAADNGKLGTHTYHNDFNEKTVKKNDKKVGDYIMIQECSLFSPTDMNGAGPLIHEFSHVLGLPDLYTVYSSNDFENPSYWDVMDNGCHNGWNKSSTIYGTCPPNYSIMELMCMGWLEPTTLTNDSIGQYTLPQIMEDKAYIIKTNQTNEYFFLENRQKTDWDKELPGHGLLVWHINYDEKKWYYNEINEEANHLHWIIEPANTSNASNRLAYYSYPGISKKTSLSVLKDSKGNSYDLNIGNITERDGYICFSTNNQPIQECPCNNQTEIETEATTIGAQHATISQDLSSGSIIVRSEFPITKWELININGKIAKAASVNSLNEISIKESYGKGINILRLTITNGTDNITTSYKLSQ